MKFLAGSIERQCGAMDLHSRSALLDGARVLQPILSLHVRRKEVHSALQEFHFHPATPGERQIKKKPKFQLNS
jgi:hypothetical protein